MYSETLEPKVNSMFEGIHNQVSSIIKSQVKIEDARREVALAVASETTAKGKTILNDMFAYLSDRLLESPGFSSIEKQNKFFELNLRSEINEKYNFETHGKVDFEESNKIVKPITAAAGTAALGGLLVFALSPASPVVPVAAVIVASLSAFCLTYFVIEPNSSKAKFAFAVKKYIDELKVQFLAWIVEVENYFNKRVEELVSSF